MSNIKILIDFLSDIFTVAFMIVGYIACIVLSIKAIHLLFKYLYF